MLNEWLGNFIHESIETSFSSKAGKDQDNVLTLKMHGCYKLLLFVEQSKEVRINQFYT